jgi:hypothetical protein
MIGRIHSRPARRPRSPAGSRASFRLKLAPTQPTNYHCPPAHANIISLGDVEHVVLILQGDRGHANLEQRGLVVVGKKSMLLLF